MTDVRLIDGYDGAYFDLDGVVYLGPEAVVRAPEGLAQLRADGVAIAYVTNNAARPPSKVVGQLNSLGIECSVADVVTSAQAAARMLAEELAPGALVLVCGTEALAAEIEAVGLRTTSRFEDEPQAVVQGYNPQMPWELIDQAVHAIQRGARWFASNTDLTRPTNLGLVPGAGAQIAAVATSVQGEPMVAGKPFPPLLHETMRRMGSKKPIFVGDRIDTDISGANNVDMDSLFVFTGAHGKRDLVSADPTGRPTHIGWDLRALLEPARVASVDDSGATVGQERVELAHGTVVWQQTAGRQAQLDALWAGLQLIWANPNVDATDFLEQLDELQ